MRSRLPSWVRFGLVLAVVAGTQVGCSSGWKMPGSDMFSWKRKPSESTLTGSGPSIQMPNGGASTASSSTSGSSPASRNTPSPISSTAVNGGRQSGPYGQSNNANNGSGAGLSANTVGYQTPVGTALGGPRPAVPGAGGAATSNGFSAPYAAPTAQTTSAMYTIPPANGGMPNTVPPNPYSVAPAPTQFTNPQAAQPTPGPYSLPPAGLGLPPSGVAGLPPSPAAPNFAAPAPSQYPPNSNAYAPTGGSTVPAMPVGYSTPALPPTAPSMSPAALPVAYGGTAPSFAPTANPPVAPAPARVSMNGSATGYQPGSTARPTNYEFSNVGPGTSAPGH